MGPDTAGAERLGAADGDLADPEPGRGRVGPALGPHDTRELGPAGADERARRRGSPRHQLVTPMPRDGWVAWPLALLITAIAGVLRFTHLAQPHAFVFDETYYAKQAWSLLRFGMDYSYAEGANERILAGELSGLFTRDLAYGDHPPLGKWMIAVGELIAGFTPFGWRLSSAAVGTATVFLLFVVARRLTRSTLLGATAALLLAVDGLSIVLSRTALLDSFLTFWLLAGFACLLRDRDWARARYAQAALDARRWRSLRWRPWRLAGGACLGMACAVKWSGIWLLAVLGLATVLWEIGALRALGVRLAWLRALAFDAPVAFVTVIGAAGLAYLSTWSSWLLRADEWSERWAGGRGTWSAFSYYHVEEYRRLSQITTEHTWASQPWGWLTQWNPVLFYRAWVPGDEQGCQDVECYRDILAVGTPVLWWGGCVALVVCLGLWLVRGDSRAGIAVAAVGAVWLPWFGYLERTTFSTYVVAAAPFMVLALVVVLGLVLGPRRSRDARRTVGAILVGVYVLTVVAHAAFLWPFASGELLTRQEWQSRMQLRSWAP